MEEAEPPSDFPDEPEEDESDFAASEDFDSDAFDSAEAPFL